MRTGLTLLQSNLLDADVKTDVSWLFEVDATGDGSVDYYWSTKAKTWSGQAYTYKVMDFSPIRLERNRSEYGVSPPSTFSFTITNEDATLLTSDFSGGNVTVRCVVKADLSGKFAPTDVASTDVTEEGFTEIEGEVFTFNFDMMTVSAQYQTLSFECRDWFTKYLEGSYPNTSSLSYLWPSIENNGGTCVPVIYGTVYIPLYSAFITDDRYYILGAAGPTYTIIKSRSPIEIPITTEWLPASYTFTPATKAGADGNNYRVFRLFGTTTSEEESSNVIYRFFGRTETVTRPVNLGTDYLSLPTKFSQTTTASTTAPTDVIDSILQDMGIPSARIDATTKATCATTHTSWGLTWNVGLFNVEDRKTILARLLQNCHMELVVRDKIYFKIHSKISQRDIERDMVIRGTFSYQGLVPERSNCGYVLYPHPSEDVPLNKLVKVLVPAKSTATIRSDYEVSCYYVPSSANAQTLGSLALQRKLLPSATISFSAKGKILQQEPDDVITIKPTDYGAPSGSSYPVLIDSFVIEKDLQVMVTATRFSTALDDWGDISPSTVTIATDTSEYAYSPIMAGPDSTGQTGTAIPNRVPGKFIVGNQTNYISFDPVIPLEAFVNNSVTRLKLGNIGTIAVPDYGIQIYDAAGTSIFKLDGTGGATGNLFCGWSLAANTITCASGVVGLNSAITGGTDWRIWAGNATAASAPFRVDENGNLVATSATISGAITAATIDIGGDDTTSFHVDIDGGIWSGESVANKATAPFRVSNAGAIVATSATITGAINATSGKFGTATNYWSVGATGLMATSASTDVIINYGKTDFTNVQTGFILGYDFSASAAKLYIGDATSYLNWDGSALTFTKGTLVENIIQMYTNVATLKTSATAGDGSINSAGVIVTYEGIFGCGASQTATVAAANANVRILATGSAFFAGAITASTIDIGGADATSFHVDTDGNIWSGAALFANGVFKVSNAGALTATSATIIGDYKTSATVGTTKGVHLSVGDNELYFYGDRGDTVIEKLASIGPESTAIISSGTYNASSRIALLGYAKNSQAFSGSVIMNNSGTDGSAGHQFLLTPILTSASVKVFDNLYVQVSRSITDGYSLGGIRGINVYSFVGDGSGIITAVDGIKIQNNFQNSTGIGTYKALNITKHAAQTITPTSYYAIYQDDTAPINFLAGYTLAKGGIRIGTTATDPGDNNFYVEGTCDIAGISTFTGLIKTAGGLHVGGVSDPGADNLLVDGTATFTGVTTLCNGLNYIGDSANAKMTIGLTINQGANDDELLTGKSSDVAHGITDISETDTFISISKINPDAGGLRIRGFGDDYYGVFLEGNANGENTTTSTAANGNVTVDTYKRDAGTGRAVLTADANLFVVENGGGAKFIVKGDGDIYYDGVDQGAYDVYDDALACQDLSYNLSNQLGKVLRYNKERLHDMGVIAWTPQENGKEDIFVSRKGMDMLQLGAIGELYRVCNVLCEKLGITFEEAKLLI